VDRGNHSCKLLTSWALAIKPVKSELKSADIDTDTNTDTDVDTDTDTKADTELLTTTN